MNRGAAIRISWFLLRVFAGLLYFHAGALIVLGWFGGMPDGAKFVLMSQTGIGGLLELVGGTMIVLGLFTRPVAFVLSGEMAVAYWQFHAPNGLWPILNHGEMSVLFCFLFLFMAAYGAGDWSLDALLRKGKEDRAG